MQPVILMRLLLELGQRAGGIVVDEPYEPGFPVAAPGVGARIVADRKFGQGFIDAPGSGVGLRDVRVRLPAFATIYYTFVE